MCIKLKKEIKIVHIKCRLNNVKIKKLECVKL